MMMIATQVREGEDHTLEPDGVPGDLKNCSGIFHLFHRSLLIDHDLLFLITTVSSETVYDWIQLMQ